MKFGTTTIFGMMLCLSLMILTSCDDGKKKAEEMKIQEERMEMEAAEKEQQLLTEKAEKEELLRTEARTNSIAGKAMSSENLTTLVTALTSADLATLLSEPGEFTVFAPSNQAFAKLPKATLESLLKPENKEQLQEVLKYHVVSGKITSDKFANAIKGAKGKYKFKTVKGEELTAMMSGDQFVIMDESGRKAQVIQGNVDASNGIVYIIDTVLMTKK